MGRRNKINKLNQQNDNNNAKNKLTPNERELAELVDKLLRISSIPQQENIAKSLENQREISTITERVKKLEIARTKKEPVVDRTSGATIDSFLKWTRENGAELHGCSIAQFEGYDLGLKADVDIGQSTLVVAVPRKIMMSVTNAKESQLRELIERDKILQSMANVTLAIFLLFEKFKGDSFWQPYIHILPQTYSTVLYFTVDELEELRGSPTLEYALNQIKSIARQYAYFHKLFNTSNDPVSKLMRTRFTYTEYCWAVSTVMTRQNVIPFENECFALIPLWDLCNHTNGSMSTAYNPALDRSECLAVREFKAGEQLFIYYGNRTNGELFVHNGFVYEDNEHDAYFLRLGLSKFDPLLSTRQKLLEKLSIPIAGGCRLSLNKLPQPISGELLAFLRVFNMNETQLQHWLESDKSTDLQYVDCALDTALEKKSWTFLKNRLVLLLAAYKTTLDDDVKLINDAQMTPNQVLAIRMRATEKRIIRDALDYVEQYIKQ